MIKKLKQLINSSEKEEDISTGKLYYTMRLLKEKYEIIIQYNLKKGSFEKIFDLYAKKLISKQNKYKSLLDFDLNLINEFPVHIDNFSLPIIERLSLEDFKKIAKKLESKTKIKIPLTLYKIEEITFIRINNSWSVKIKYSGQYTY